eukprot:GDKJ01050386.1.p1 GENE.GDKJ01050386.1~~GDKJ01050386.1.p1  ORF type:complete len:202 (-),score=42.36 GDKJ01050386.1:1273-1878(-)
MDPQQNNSSSSTPLFCANDCGFFGNSATKNMCSKCFRETLKQEEADAASAKRIEAPTVAPTSPTLTSVLAEEKISECNVDVSMSSAASPMCPPVSSEIENIPAFEPISAPVPDVFPGPVPETDCKMDVEETLPVKAQKPGRCFKCDKKVGLLGFTCRCEFTFCGLHRLGDAHECDFDYKTLKRAELSKANQTVAADKVKKI